MAPLQILRMSSEIPAPIRGDFRRAKAVGISRSRRIGSPLFRVLFAAPFEADDIRAEHLAAWDGCGTFSCQRLFFVLRCDLLLQQSRRFYFMTGRIVNPPLRNPLLPIPMKVGIKKRQIARSSKGRLRVADQ